MTLIDLSRGGVETIEAIRREFPTANILILTVYDGDEAYHTFKTKLVNTHTCANTTMSK